MEKQGFTLTTVCDQSLNNLDDNIEVHPVLIKHTHTILLNKK